MNSQELNKIINNQTPKYASNKRALIERISKKGTPGERSTYSLLGPFYEAFMLAFFLGFNRNERVKPPEDKIKFLPFGEWKPETMAKEVLSHVITRHSNIFDFNEMELSYSDDQIKTKIKELFDIIEEYANAGLIYLEKKLLEDPSEFNDPFVFILFLTKVTDQSLEK